jgi:hypothetical protein
MLQVQNPPHALGPIEVEGRNQYQFSHGHFPRGRGSWAFAIGGKKELDDLFWFNGTYGEAVKAAKAKAREVGVCYVTVQT